jgi:two-component system nitrogen regulation response regulator NtrX
MIIMTGGGVIDLPDLAGILRAPDQAGGAPGRSGADGEVARTGTLREFKDSAERAFLVARLRDNGWNISKTAEVIDTPRSNLYKKLEQYRISQETDG